MILLDTSPLVALCDAKDGKHRTAVAHLASLAAEDFAVCDAVLTEACFHLPHLHQRPDHDPDWADGCLAVLSGRDKHLKLWTYGREFRTAWRRPNGTALPLAVR